MSVICEDMKMKMNMRGWQWNKTNKTNPKINQKSSQNRPRIVPKSTPNRSKIGPGTDIASETLFGPILVPFWSQLGAILGAQIGPCWGHVDQKSVQEGIRKLIWFWTLLKTLLGTILGRFSAPKSTQNRSRIGLKSDEAKNAKMLKNNWFFNVFWSLGGSKMDQKSIKIASEIKMPKRHPKMSQKVPNMAPKSAQVGAMLGSKTVLDPPKSEEKTTQKTTQKKTPQT